MPPKGECFFPLPASVVADLSSIAGLNASNQWFLAEGGAAIKIKDASGKDKCVGAIGVSGCFPATIDQEIADESGVFRDALSAC